MPGENREKRIDHSCSLGGGIPGDDDNNTRRGSLSSSSSSRRSSNTMIPLPRPTKFMSATGVTINPKTVKTKRNRLRLIMENKEAFDAIEKEEQEDRSSYDDRYGRNSTILRYSKVVARDDDTYRTSDCKVIVLIMNTDVSVIFMYVNVSLLGSCRNRSLTERYSRGCPLYVRSLKRSIRSMD